MKLVLKIVLGAVCLASLIYFTFSGNSQKRLNVENEHTEYRYVTTRSGPPTSFDPKKADSTNNLAAARMRYLTPIEIGYDDGLYSSVLESFSYDINEDKIVFVVKEGLRFSNGKSITVDDVILAITRTAYFYPDLPTITSIKGLNEWKNLEFPLKSLPSGISSNGQKITILVEKKLRNPLFRFSLELFSIIPGECVNLENAELTCEIPAASGYYDFEPTNKNPLETNRWRFIKRADYLEDSKKPKIINIVYRNRDPLNEVLHELDTKNTVIASTDSRISNSDFLKIEEKYDTLRLPRSRFAYLIINPEREPFKKKECRRYYADIFRKKIAEFRDKTASRSMFSLVLPGYISESEFDKLLEPIDEKYCKAQFEKFPIEVYETEGSTFSKIMKIIDQEYGFNNLKLNIVETFQETRAKFVEGKAQLGGGSMGYWPLDPANDVKMMFTPGLHLHYKYQTSDKILQDTIDLLVEETNPEKAKSLYRKINMHINEKAVYLPLINYGKVFIGSKENRKRISAIPVATTAVAPWHMF